MKRIHTTPEPARTELPAGWEWRTYGARHIATGRCVCWAQQAARWIADNTVGNFRSLSAAIAATGV